MELTTLITLIGSVFAILSTTICLFLHLGNKMDAVQRTIYQEMKDFHGRLEKQDAYFRGRMEKMDIELKSHVMYGHVDHKED